MRRTSILICGLVVLGLVVWWVGRAMRGGESSADDRAADVPATTRGVPHSRDSGQPSPHPARRRAPVGDPGGVADEGGSGGRTMSGHVRAWDASSPVPHSPPTGAVVVLCRPTPHGALGFPIEPASAEVATVPVEDDGAFAVTAPSEGEWVLLPRADGFVGCPRRSRTGSVGVDLRLVRDLPEVIVHVFAKPYGAPLADAVVVAGRSDSDGGSPPTYEFVPRARVVTDAKGDARIRVDGEESLCVIARGFATRAVARPSRDEAVWLSPGDRIEGVVVDVSGAPVAGARICAPGLECGGAWTSGESGRFVLEGIEAGSDLATELVVEAAGAKWEGSISAGTTDAVVVLRSVTSNVAGIVLLPDGSPAAGASLWPSGTTTQSDGRFSIPADPSGHMVVRAFVTRAATPNAPPDLDGSVSFDVPASGAIDGVTIRLAPIQRSFVVVRVVDADGKRVAGAECGVRFGRHEPRRADAETIVVDAPPGSEMQVWFDGHVGGERAYPRAEMPVVTVPSPDADPVLLRLPALREITVDVMFPDGPGPPVTPWSFGARAAEGAARVGLGERNSFTLIAPLRMAPASATWRADASGPLVLVGRAVGFAEVNRVLSADEVASGRAVLRFERGATVAGRLVSRDANAQAAAQVLLARDGGTDDLAHVLRPARRLEDGTFQFDSVGAGRWTLFVHWPDSMVAVERELEVAGNLPLGDVSVPTTARIHGTATLAGGRPAGGATVRFESGRDDGWGGSAASFVRSDGTFELDVAAAARGAVLVSRDGWGTAVVRADAATDAPLRVELAPEGRLEVRIRLPRRVGSAWSASVRTPDGAARWQPQAEPCEDLPGIDAVHRFRGLAAGPIVAVAGGSGWTLEAAATIVAGETVVVTLDGHAEK